MRLPIYYGSIMSIVLHLLFSRYARVSRFHICMRPELSAITAISMMLMSIADIIDTDIIESTFSASNKSR